MDLTPGSVVTVRTRGGRVCKMTVPPADTQRYVHMQYAVGVGDIVLGAGGQAAEPAAEVPSGDDLDALRAEYEELTGQAPHPRMKAETLRQRIEDLRAADDGAAGDDPDDDE